MPTPRRCECAHSKRVWRPPIKVLELHWQLLGAPWKNPWRMDPEELIEDSLQLNFNGNALRVLCPEHEIVHLCLAAARDGLNEGYIKTIQLLDMAVLMDHHAAAIDWHKLDAFAQSADGAGTVSAVLKLAGPLRGTAVPKVGPDGPDDASTPHPSLLPDMLFGDHPDQGRIIQRELMAPEWLLPERMNSFRGRLRRFLRKLWPTTEYAREKLFSEPGLARRYYAWVIRELLQQNLRRHEDQG